MCYTLFFGANSGMVIIYVLKNHFVIRVTIYGNTSKCVSVIHVLDQFLDVNSMVMSVWWSGWPFMAILTNVWVLYTFLNCFLMWIQWWCPFCDWSDHIWQYQQMCECYTWSEPVFWCKFNSDVCLVIAILYTPPQVHVHSMQTVRSPMESAQIMRSPCELHTKIALTKDWTKLPISEPIAAARCTLYHCTMKAC